MSFPTLSPFIRHCLPTLQATLCPLPLPLLCLPTTSLVQVPRWPSTCLRTTRPCHTIYRHSGLRCRGFINTRCCRGWRSRGAGWCSTPREYRHCVLSLSHFAPPPPSWSERQNSRYEYMICVFLSLQTSTWASSSPPTQNAPQLRPRTPHPCATNYVFPPSPAWAENSMVSVRGNEAGQMVTFSPSLTPV